MTEKLTLTELQLIIRDSLYMSLPGFYWVIAEISEIKVNNAGHCYLELIEKHPDEKNARARIRAIIWNKRYGFLSSYFENITGESLREGLNILIKAKVEYHELYGLSLVITDIDPSFTIGEMALKRQLIIKRLEEEGVFTMNKELEMPLVPQRIAVISSKSAAGYSDFITHLSGNSYGYIFYTTLIESAMQGIEMEQDIISALDKIALNSIQYDVVVIIRGGGSQADLSWFDNYNIAYHVTQFPLPVITGIGHEKDLSVTDMVAHTSLKTPTAVADHLINCVYNTEDELIGIGTEIKNHSKLIIERNRNRIESSGIKLLPMVRIMLAGIKESLSGRIIELINIGKENTSKAGRIPSNQESRLRSSVKTYSSVKQILLDRRRQSLLNGTITILKKNNVRVDGIEKTLSIMKPENVLRRGYTITSVNGRIIKTKELLSEDDLIDTQFIDGSIKSVVVNPEKVQE